MPVPTTHLLSQSLGALWLGIFIFTNFLGTLMPSRFKVIIILIVEFIKMRKCLQILIIIMYMSNILLKTHFFREMDRGYLWYLD